MYTTYIFDLLHIILNVHYCVIKRRIIYIGGWLFYSELLAKAVLKLESKFKKIILLCHNNSAMFRSRIFRKIHTSLGFQLSGQRVCECSISNNGDTGFIRDLEYFPIRDLRFGDTGAHGEWLYYTLGPLRCIIGKKYKELSKTIVTDISQSYRIYRLDLL